MTHFAKAGLCGAAGAQQVFGQICFVTGSLPRQSGLPFRQEKTMAIAISQRCFLFENGACFVLVGLSFLVLSQFGACRVQSFTMVFNFRSQTMFARIPAEAKNGSAEAPRRYPYNFRTCPSVSYT